MCLVAKRVQKEIDPWKNECFAWALPDFQVCTNGLKCGRPVRRHRAVLRLKENSAEHPVLCIEGYINEIHLKLRRTTYML
jgi:hypothetical protein